MCMAYLWLQVTMDVTKLMKLVDGGKHLANIEPRMFFLENARVVEQRPEIASWYVLHREINVFGILECV